MQAHLVAVACEVMPQLQLSRAEKSGLWACLLDLPTRFVPRTADMQFLLKVVLAFVCETAEDFASEVEEDVEGAPAWVFRWKARNLPGGRALRWAAPLPLAGPVGYDEPPAQTIT